MISITNASKYYPQAQRPALEGINLVIKAGELVYLTGPSGAGKTSLLRLLFASEYPTSGTVSIAGADLGRLPAGKIPLLRRKIGVIFQDFKLIPAASVYENVALSLCVTGVSKRELSQRVFTMLERVDLLDRAWDDAGALSGGEQQRAAIARALVSGPPILLADEPTGNLDPANAREVMRLILSANQRGSTVIIATHDPGLVAMAPRARLIRLEKGRLGVRG